MNHLRDLVYSEDRYGIFKSIVESIKTNDNMGFEFLMKNCPHYFSVLKLGDTQGRQFWSNIPRGELYHVLYNIEFFDAMCKYLNYFAKTINLSGFLSCVEVTGRPLYIGEMILRKITFHEQGIILSDSREYSPGLSLHKNSENKYSHWGDMPSYFNEKEAQEYFESIEYNFIGAEEEVEMSGLFTSILDLPK